MTPVARWLCILAEAEGSGFSEIPSLTNSVVSDGFFSYPAPVVYNDINTKALSSTYDGQPTAMT